MSKARDLINAHLYPVLATFAVVYGAIQIAPIAQQARSFNTCVQSAVELEKERTNNTQPRQISVRVAVGHCNSTRN